MNQNNDLTHSDRAVSATQFSSLPETWTRIATADPHEAKLRTETLLACSHLFTVSGRGRDLPFEAQVAHASLTNVGLMSSHYGSAVEIVCRPPMPVVTISIVRRGSITFTDEKGSPMTVVEPGHGAVVAYDRTVRMQWAADTEQLMLLIGKNEVERTLERLLGDRIASPLSFDPALDISGDGHAVTGLFGSLSRVLSSHRPSRGPSVLADEVERSIITSLLVSQRHNFSDQLFADRSRVLPRIVRRVVEMMEATDHEQLRMSDLVAYAGVSERALHEAFKKHLGASPMAYLRRRRLEQAHEELLALDPASGISVTDVALRWGFNHGGRFAAAYRGQFGESPSQTLRH